MYNVDITHLRRAVQAKQAVQKKFEAFKDKYQTTITKVVRTAEVGIGALAGGVIQGRSGDGLHVLGMPVEVLGGLALNIAGHVGVADGASDHLVAVGDGLLASFVNHLGYGIGRSWKESGKLFGGHHLAETKTSGALPSGMDANQMADMITRMQTAG